MGTSKCIGQCAVWMDRISARLTYVHTHPHTLGRHNVPVVLRNFICLSTSQRVPRNTRHSLPAIKYIEEVAAAREWSIAKALIKLKLKTPWLKKAEREEENIARSRLGACA